MNAIDFFNKYLPANLLNVEVALFGLILSVGLWLIYSRTKSKQLLNYIPTMWTSLGVLGTFISLVESLADLQIDPTNIATLIDSISPAFVTSIIGISGAVFFSVIIKISYACQERREFLKFPDEMKKLSPEECLYNVERLLFDAKTSLDVFPLSMQKQLNDLNSLIGNIAVTNERFLEDHLKQQEKFYNELHNAEGDRIVKIKNEYIKSLEQLVERSDETIKNQVSEIISGHIVSIKDNIEKGNDAITHIIDKQKDNLNKVADASLNAIENIQKNLEERNVEFCNSLLEKFQEFESSLASDEEQKLSEQVQDLKKKMVELTCKWQELMDTETNLLSDSLRKMGDYNRSSIVELHESSETYKQLLKQITLLVATIDDLCKQMDANK